MLTPGADQSWPEGATVLGWYAGGSSDNPHGEPCLWLAHDLPGEPGHLTVRPSRLAPPGVVLRERFGGTETDDEPGAPWAWDVDLQGFRYCGKEGGTG